MPFASEGMKRSDPFTLRPCERSVSNRGRRVIGVVLLAGLLGGCALHYFDQDTGTEHVWGIGHLKMKVAPADEGLRAIVRGTDVLGLSLGRADQQFYFTLGWHRVQRLDVVNEHTAIRLEWPSANFASVRVGSRFPLGPGGDAAHSSEEPLKAPSGCADCAGDLE